MSDRADISQDVALLNSRPERLILKHSDAVRIIVKKYISLGMFRPSEYEDVVQSVLESLLEKIPAMRSQYNGSVLFVTYLSSIVKNICLGLHKTSTRRVHTVPLYEIASSDHTPDHEVRVVDDAVKRLRTILVLYDRKLPKVLLALKLHYRLPITEGDLQSWYPDANNRDRTTILRAFGKYFEHVRDPELFRRVTPILNRLEEKSNQPDSLRRFITVTIGDILRLLNGTPARYAYDEDSLSVLVEHYFFRI